MKFFALVAVLLLSCQLVLSYPVAHPDEAIQGRHSVFGLGGLGGLGGVGGGYYQGGYIGGYGGHAGSFGGYNNGFGGYNNGFAGQGVVVPGIVGIQHGGLYNGGYRNGGILGGNIW